MENLQPIDILETFVTKSGKSAILRPLREDDVLQLMDYINAISSEDTFITYSGEQFDSEQEQKFVRNAVASMGARDGLYLLCQIDGRIVAEASIHRDTTARQRSRHIAVLGITVAKEHRGDGLGRKLLEQLCANAGQLPEVTTIELSVFGNNTSAISLYKSLGFTEVARIPDRIAHRGQLVDQVIMQRQVDQQ